MPILSRPTAALAAGSNPFQSLVICNQANKDSTLGGVIDSTKEYFIDGIIDMGTTQITVPVGGISLRGHTFDISGLTSSEDNYTMFVSETPVIGSGNMIGADYFISVTGTNSKVYEVYSATGFDAFEFLRINYNDCTSLGIITDYRQGLEEGTGRFGASPSLTLDGTWVGGYRITTSIVRSMSDTTAEPLFKAGATFQMQSRFLTDINCDLGTLQPFCDFDNSSFPNPSTVQLKGCLISRDSVFDAEDTNILPNLSPADLECDWEDNIGVLNTFVGGSLSCSTEVETTIAVINTPVVLAGTFTPTNLQHFDTPATNELRHLGISPIEFNTAFDFVLDGASNDVYKISLVHEDALAVETTIYSQSRIVNNSVGGRDVAYFSGQTYVTLKQNERVFWKVENTTSTANCTLELDSSWFVSER